MAEVQPVDSGTNNADKTNTSEKEDNSVGQYDTKRIHVRETTNQWFPLIRKLNFQLKKYINYVFRHPC